MQSRDAPESNGGGEQAPDGLGVRPSRVLGDIHHAQSLPHGEPDRFFGAALQVIDGPILGVLTDGTRPDEATALNRHAGALDDVGNRLDVRNHSARRAVRPDAKTRLDNRPRQHLDVSHHVWSGAGKTDVGGVDPGLVEQVQQMQLLVD